MFIDIDYSKRPKNAKLHLAKPNKKIIDHLHEKEEDSVIIKLGNISELSFTIPHFIDGEYNNHVEIIREKMLIKLTMESYLEWFVIDEIIEDGNESDKFNVKAFSLGYELKGKLVELEEDSINATDFLNLILEGTAWSVGIVAPMFDAMYRSISISDSNSLDALTQGVETFGALVEYDTENRKINFKDFEENGRFRGLTINYGKYLNSITRNRTTDEMVTRMYIEGSEGLTVNSVNPTGQDYIEDFSYFMFPFERDINKNVIKSSYFMSNELCHALLNKKNALSNYSDDIILLQNQLSVKESLLISMDMELEQARLELSNIEQLLDVAKSAEDNTAINQRRVERDNKISDIQARELARANTNGERLVLISRIDNYHNRIVEESGFNSELLEELNIYIIEKSWKDDRYTDVEELYKDGVKEFVKIREPKVVIDITMDNLLGIVEEQYYWDKLTLGDLIKVKYPQMKIEYMAKIIEIEYDLANGEAKLIIANNKDLLDDNEKLLQLLYQSSSASTIVENNKYKWDKINKVSKEVNAILKGEWDANKNKITAGVNNSIEVGTRGIIIKNPDFPNEVVVMQSGIIALSKDGGETWKTAIKPDGIVAERLIGQIIAGQELLITNSSGSFMFDNDGVVIDANSFVVRSSNGNKNLVNEWNGSKDFIDSFKDDNILTPYEKRAVKSKWESILAEYNSVTTRLQGYFEDGGETNLDVISYKQKYQNLYNYLFVTLQADTKSILDSSNMTEISVIVGSVYERTFKDYENSKLAIENLLSIRAKELSNDALEQAKQAIKDIEEVMNDGFYKIELTSSNGFMFKNGDINTVITAKVYRGTTDITSTIPNSGFIWKKYDKDGVLDVAWNNAHVNVGKEITVLSNDILRKSTFSCDIDINE